MSDAAFTHAGGDASLAGRPRAFETILYGGLVVGILDGLFALVFYGLIYPSERHKVWPTNADRASFVAVITCGGRDALDEKFPPQLPTQRKCMRTSKESPTVCQ